MANWIRIPLRLSNSRVFSWCVGARGIRSFSAFSSTMQHIDSKKTLVDSKNCMIKKRNMKWETSYSNMTQEAAFKRLGLDIEELDEGAIPVKRMVSEAGSVVGAIGENNIVAMKEKVHQRIVEFIRMEGFPSEASIRYNEVNVNDLVLFILGPIILDFQSVTGRQIRLRREMELVSLDSKTGGYEEFVIVDKISTNQQSFILIIESKRSAVGHAIRQCLLALYDMYSYNGEGKAYGFVTTGELWRMICYDGKKFQITETFFAVFGEIRHEKQRWIEEFSIVVDCLLIALNRGGVVNKKI